MGGYPGDVPKKPSSPCLWTSTVSSLGGREANLGCCQYGAETGLFCGMGWFPGWQWHWVGRVLLQQQGPGGA